MTDNLPSQNYLRAAVTGRVSDDNTIKAKIIGKSGERIITPKDWNQVATICFIDTVLQISVRKQNRKTGVCKWASQSDLRNREMCKCLIVGAICPIVATHCYGWLASGWVYRVFRPHQCSSKLLRAMPLRGNGGTPKAWWVAAAIPWSSAPCHTCLSVFLNCSLRPYAKGMTELHCMKLAFIELWRGQCTHMRAQDAPCNFRLSVLKIDAHQVQTDSI